MTMKISVFPAIACAVLLVLSGCSSSSDSPPAPQTPTPPTVSSTDPTPGASGIAANVALTVTFSVAMDPATVNTTTFTLRDSANQAVSGTVSCAGATATFTPSNPLDYLITYTARVTTGAKNTAGTALAADHPWSFTVDTTPSPLLSAQTLKAWVDHGLVNGPAADRVIVLDVANTVYSTTGHVPGAHLVGSTSIYQNRQEGPAVDVNMVPDAEHIDSVVRAYGIDDRTTIVFTSNQVMSATRGYWTFRYWGFPKAHLKVLDGVNTSWGPYGLTTVAPPSVSSTYSVASNGSVRTDLRASLSEMIEVVSSIAAGTLPNTVIIDARSGPTAGSYAGVAGSTAGVFAPPPPAPPAPDTNDSVVFEGHMKNAQALSYATLYDGTNRFMSPEFLATTFEAVGVTTTTTTYVHCRTGVIASVPFFVLDAILDWPVVNYDGSWSQWGQLSANAAQGGQLADTSPWITDTLTDWVTYNHSASKPVELLALDGSVCSATLNVDGSIVYKAGCSALTAPASDAASGNQIEEKDAQYQPE